MSLPFTPEDAKNLVSDPTSSLCGNLVRTLLRLPVLFYQLISELFDDAGSPKSVPKAGDMIQSFSSAGEDTHRKLCNGQALDKTQFALLYAAVGDVFNTMPDEHGVAQAAPGGNLFRVPRCGGRFALATGSLDSTTAVNLGSVGGEEEHVLLAIELAKHTHKVWPVDDGDGNAGKVWSHFDAGGESDTAGLGKPIMPDDANSAQTVLQAEEQDTGDEGHNTMPPYYGVFTYIITGI